MEQQRILDKDNLLNKENGKFIWSIIIKQKSK
jgi:hypothetical protein